jgi:hypothetical protein
LVSRSSTPRALAPTLASLPVLTTLLMTTQTAANALVVLLVACPLVALSPLPSTLPPPTLLALVSS